MQIVIEQTAPVALAVFAMWRLNEVWKARLDEAQRYANEVREQRQELLGALNRNTEALVRLCERKRDAEKGA